jgi:thiol-disulfide isomerase/thioredoxin
MKRSLFALTCLLIFMGAAGRPPASLQPVLAAHDWLNERATAATLAGKVVVLDVFTVDCYNCQNVVPELRTLYAADGARGLAVVGIHSPETPAERGRSYVASSLHRQGIVWPVAIDNAFSLWNDYGVSAWPTQLIFDRHGQLRETIVGDSQDAAVAAAVEKLLTEK